MTDEELQRLAPFLIDQWKDVAHRLLGGRLTAFEWMHTQTDRSDPKERVYSMLNNWHIVNGSDATVKSICSALVQRPVIHRLAAEEVFGVGVVKQVLRYWGY